MWLLLTVTVTCMCASPRCRSSAASLSFTAYCQKLCMWGRGGNLCRCNAVHFVGKRRDVRQQQTGQDIQYEQLTGKNLYSDDEKLWNDDDNRDDDDDDDDDEFRTPEDLLVDENSTSASDVLAEQNHDSGSSAVARVNSHRRHQPMIFLALRRLSRRYGRAENTDDDPLLTDSAKKGERRKHLGVDERRGLMTLNPLTRRPTTFSLPPKILRKMTSQSREFQHPVMTLLHTIIMQH